MVRVPVGATDPTELLGELRALVENAAERHGAMGPWRVVGQTDWRGRRVQTVRRWAEACWRRCWRGGGCVEVARIWLQGNGLHGVYLHVPSCCSW